MQVKLLAIFANFWLLPSAFVPNWKDWKAESPTQISPLRECEIEFESRDCKSPKKIKIKPKRELLEIRVKARSFGQLLIVAMRKCFFTLLLICQLLRFLKHLIFALFSFRSFGKSDRGKKVRTGLIYSAFWLNTKTWIFYW